MKTLLFILFLFPALVIAQETGNEMPRTRANKWELGLNTGIALSAGKGNTFYDDAFLVGRNNISLYYNFSAAQAGGRVEVGYSPLGRGWFIAPELIINKILDFKRLYLYTGASAGYKRTQNQDDGSVNGVSSGCVAGLQAGVVYHLGGRFSLNAEAAFKTEKMWARFKERYPTLAPTDSRIVRLSEFNVYFPIFIGARYRF